MTNTNVVLAFQAAATRQRQVNERINPEWMEAKNPWYRAISCEANEAMGHLNWPWWSGGSAPLIPNEKARLQFYLELADCFAFGLSLYLEQEALDGEGNPWSLTHSRCARALEASERTTQDILGNLDSVIGDASMLGDFNAAALFAVARLAGLDATGLLLFHEGKSVLNIFRQEHGYKEGKYTKLWWFNDEQVEDNVALAELIVQYKARHDSAVIEGMLSGDFSRFLRSNLAIAYSNSQERYSS